MNFRFCIVGIYRCGIYNRRCLGSAICAEAMPDEEC